MSCHGMEFQFTNVITANSMQKFKLLAQTFKLWGKPLALMRKSLDFIVKLQTFCVNFVH